MNATPRSLRATTLAVAAAMWAIGTAVALATIIGPSVGPAVPKWADRVVPAAQEEADEVFLPVEENDCFIISSPERSMTYAEVDCSLPHRGEVVLITELPEGPYPGWDDLVDDDLDRCAEHLANAVGPAAAFDLWEHLASFAPFEEGWVDGDRTVICVLEYTSPRVGRAIGTSV